MSISELREAKRKVLEKSIEHFNWHKSDECEVCVAVRGYLEVRKKEGKEA